MNRKRIGALMAACLLVSAMVLLAESEEGRREGHKEISGSIAMPPHDAMLVKLAKVSLVDAIKAAQKGVPGTPVSAELEGEDGFLVYSVDIATASQTIEVIVDAGTGKVLQTEVDEEEGEEGHEHSRIERGEHGEKGGHHARGEDEGEEDDDD